MFEPSQGIFTVDELNTIRDVHVEWCASRSIDPQSPLGLDAVKLVMQSYRDGVSDPEILMEKCESFIAERESHVRIGSPVIASRDAELNNFQEGQPILR